MTCFLKLALLIFLPLLAAYFRLTYSIIITYFVQMSADRQCNSQSLTLYLASCSLTSYFAPTSRVIPAHLSLMPLLEISTCGHVTPAAGYNLLQLNRTISNKSSYHESTLKAAPYKHFVRQMVFSELG